jgi:osmoprotectant transport system permease protein
LSARATLRGLPGLLVLLVLLVAAPAAARPAVTVCSKKFTESVILGEAAAQLLRASGLSVAHRAQLGSTRVVWNALVAGECDVYPEYTGTLAADLFAGNADLVGALRASGMQMSGSLGFRDSYALGMLERRAAALGIRRISELAPHPELRFGFSEEFTHRPDGWPGIRDRYGLGERDLRVVDHDLAYRGLGEAALDVIDLYTTDAEIARYGIRVLDDDRHQLGDYQAVLVWRADLAARAPAGVTALRRLEGRIDARQMAALNARAKLDHVSESAVAAELLSQLGLAGSEQRESRLRALGRHTVEHLFLVVVSLLAAIAVSLPLGIWAARRRRIGQGILAVSGVLQTIPSLALLAALIPLVGIGAPPALGALFLYSILPIVRNTYTGLVDIPPAIRESAEALGLSPRARLRAIELPMASRAILAGIKTSAVINVGTATLGAIIGAGGYGEPILSGVRLDDVGLIVQGAVPAAAMALAAQLLFDALERVVVPRGLRLKAAA